MIARGEHLLARLHELVKKHPAAAIGARGKGCSVVSCSSPTVDTRAVLGALRDRGVLVSQAGDRVVRFAPPLIVTDLEIDEGIARSTSCSRTRPATPAPVRV